MRNAWKSEKVHSAGSRGKSAANTVGKKMLYASWIIGIYGEKLRRVIYRFSSSIREKWDIKQVG